MFILSSENNSKENQSLIDFLKSSIKDVYEIHTLKDLINYFSKNQPASKMPGTFILFVQDVKKSQSLLDKIQNILNENHQMVYFIAIAENELKKEEKFLSDNFESYFIKPFEWEELLKEAKKGSDFISGLSSHISEQSELLENEKHFELDGIHLKQEYKIDTELIGIKRMLQKIKRNATLKEKEEIYEKLKENLVWPGKIIIKNASKGSLYYNDDHFELNEEKDFLIGKSLGVAELLFSKLELISAADIEADFMKAHAFLFPVGGKDAQQAVQNVYEGLVSCGVKKGINYDKLLKAYQPIFRDQYIDYVEVAQGKHMEIGYNEYIDLLIKDEKKVGKVKDKLGRMDFRERDSIINIFEGDLIAKSIPAKKAEEGYLVNGKTLSAKTESKDGYKIGENILEDKATGEYKAATDGMLVFEGSTIHVKETLVIKGDVDLETGNIHSNKNVLIQGNVNPEMYVEAKGNIIIKGVVENAKVIAGGDIEVHGLTGSGKTWIFSRSKVRVDFCQNSHIEALGDITFSKYIVNSKIYSTQKVIGLDKSRLIGGFTEAAQGCELFDAGNSQFIGTKVILGVNFYNERILKKLMQRINILKSEKEQLVQLLQFFLDLNKPLEPQLKTIDPEEAVLLKQRLLKLKKIHKMILQMQKSFKQQTSNIREEFNAKCIVYGRIYPEVSLFIAGVEKRFKKIFAEKEFYFAPSLASIENKKISSLKERSKA